MKRRKERPGCPAARLAASRAGTQRGGRCLADYASLRRYYPGQVL